MPADFWTNALYSVAPTILVGLVFWFILRAIIRSDRNERKVYAQIEAEERAKLAAPVGSAVPDGSVAPRVPAATVVSPVPGAPDRAPSDRAPSDRAPSGD